MTQEPAAKHPFSLVNMLVVWLAILVLMTPAMFFVVKVEREVGQYATTTFESFARKALAAGEWNKAARICTGAVKVGLNRSDFWGLAHLLKAEALAGAGKDTQAIDEARYSARLWTRGYYFAKEENRNELADFATGLAIKQLGAGNVDAAKKALSAAGVGSGNPVKYLRTRYASLSAPQRQALWPDGSPSLTLEDFEGAGAPILENTADEQGRMLLQSRVAVDGTSRIPCAEVHVGNSTKEGRSWYQMPVYLPLVQDKFALRAILKQSQPSDVGLVLSYWFQAANKAAVTFDKPAKEADGWKCFDIQRDFYKQRAETAAKEGYDVADGIIYRLGIDIKPGPENTFNLAKVELYLPKVP